MNCFRLFSNQSESRILFQTDTMHLEPDHKASVTPFGLLGVDEIASNHSVRLKAGKALGAADSKTDQPGPECSLSRY